MKERNRNETKRVTKAKKSKLTRTRRFLLREADGWTTIVRRAPRAAPRDSSRTARSPRIARSNSPSSQISKLSYLFSRPNPSPHPRPALLPLLPKPAPHVTVQEPNNNHRPLTPPAVNKAKHPTLFPTLFKPRPAQTTSPSPVKLSYRTILQSNNTMSSSKAKSVRSAGAKDKAPVDKWAKGAKQLPLPPGSNKEAWKGRCFRCLDLGHDRIECSAKVPTCAYCRVDGHETWKCGAASEAKKKAALNPLVAKGNLGEDKLPVSRPVSITVCVPQTRESYKDLKFLQRAIVIDARLWDAHTPSGVQARVMAVCDSNEPFELSPFTEDRYILLLPAGTIRQQFLKEFSVKLEELSLVMYPWSPRIGAEPINYNFKVWLDLCRVPLTAWNFENLVPMLAQVGLILDHTPFEKVLSLSRMRVVLAIRSLDLIPRIINYGVRGLESEVRVRVVGWENHVTEINIPLDPTPSQEYFIAVQKKLSKEPLRSEQSAVSSGSLPINIEDLFDWWEQLPASDHKSKLEGMLRQSPLWAVREKQGLLAIEKGRAADTMLSPPTRTYLRGSGSKSVADPVIENQSILPPPAEKVIPVTILAAPGKRAMVDNSQCSPHSCEAANDIEAEQGHFLTPTVVQKPSKRHASASKGSATKPKLAAGRKNSGKGNVARAISLGHEDRPTQHVAEIKKGMEKGKRPADTQPSPQPNKGTKKPRGRKNSVGAAKAKVIKEALDAANLSKCTTMDEVVATPLTEEELDKIKDFCSIIAEEVIEPAFNTTEQVLDPVEPEQNAVEPMKETVEPGNDLPHPILDETEPTLNPLEQLLEQLGTADKLLGNVHETPIGEGSQEGHGETLSGLDEWYLDEFTEDDEEAGDNIA